MPQPGLHKDRRFTASGEKRQFPNVITHIPSNVRSKRRQAASARLKNAERKRQRAVKEEENHVRPSSGGLDGFIRWITAQKGSKNVQDAS